MPIPILTHKDCLVASIQSSASDQDLLDLRDQLVHLAGEEHSTGIVLDVSDLDVLDSFSVRLLRDMAATVSQHGAKTVVVGIQPDVAWTMVQQGLSFEGIQTALDLEDGLAYVATN